MVVEGVRRHHRATPAGSTLSCRLVYRCGLGAIWACVTSQHRHVYRVNTMISATLTVRYHPTLVRSILFSGPWLSDGRINEERAQPVMGLTLSAPPLALIPVF